MSGFPHRKQLHLTDCGPTCLKMIADYYGIYYDPKYLEKISGMNKTGTNLLGISKAAKSIGLNSTGRKVTIKELQEVGLPAIVHWNQNHFVVLYKIKNGHYYIADPASDILKLSKAEFMYHWLGTKADINAEGVLLMVSLIQHLSN